MPVLQKGNHNPYQYISKDLLDCKTLKFAKSDQVHESLHPLLDTLSKQQSEIAELENMLDNFDEFWMSGWKSSQEPGSFVLEEMQASEGGMMLDHDEEELFFQARIDYTQFMMLRRGIQSEREEIGCDFEAWKRYRMQKRMQMEMEMGDGGELEGGDQGHVRGVEKKRYDDYERHQAHLEEQGWNRSGNQFDHDFNDDYGEAFDAGFNDRFQDGGMYENGEDEEEEEMIESGRSACIVHGFCDHVTSECPDAPKLLESGQYYLATCDPRNEGGHTVKIPVFEKAKEEAMVNRRSKLYMYEDNRQVYNFL